MSSSSGPDIVTDGLVLNLDAANRIGYPGSGTTWFDRSGNSNNGTLFGGVGFNRVNAGSMVFDGVDDYGTIEANSSFQLGNGYTLYAWVKPNNIPSNYGGICGTFDIIPSSYFGSNFSLQPSIQRFHFLVGGSSTTYIPALADYIIGQWYNLVGTISGAECKFYVNGTLNTIHTQPSASSAPGPTTKFKLGRFYQDNNNYYFNGSIATCGFYNRALSASEILQNYNVTKSRFGL